MASKELCIEHAWKYPYCAPHKPRNRFEFIAEAILADLRDRSGIGDALDIPDHQIRQEIRDDIAAIVAEIISKELPDPEPKEWRYV